MKKLIVSPDITIKDAFKILSNAGLEFVIYDQEHSNISYEQLKPYHCQMIF